MVSWGLLLLLCLSRTASGDWPGAACTTACPGVQAMMDGMFQDGITQSELFGSLLCTHRDALACLGDNEATCSEGTDLGRLRRLTDNNRIVPCLCDHCPGSGVALGDFMTTLLSPEVIEHHQDVSVMLPLVCPMLDTFQCFGSHNCGDPTAGIGCLQNTNEVIAACEAWEANSTDIEMPSCPAYTASASSPLPGLGVAAVLAALLC